MTTWDDLFNPPPQAPLPGGPLILTDPGQASSYAAAALRREAEAVAATPEGGRNDALNRAAFRMGRHIGAGNIDAHVVRDTLAAAGRAAGLPQHEIDLILRDTADSGLAAGAQHPRHPAPLAPVPSLTVLPDPAPEVEQLDAETEEAFWAARPLLAHLRTFAQARRVSPWAVLGVTLARIITATPFEVCLPPIVGGKASLNLFVGLVGPSGAGKGAAEAVAADAVHLGRYITTHNVGSGEGIAHGYMRRVKGNLEWLDDDHAVLFSVPEIDSLAAQGDRKGATLMPQLRSGWTGEQLGFGYADPTKRIIVPAHEYRLCLVAGIQPGRAGCLLDDADGGTPQRFLWMPAIDPDAPEEAPAEPEPLIWNPPALGRFVTVGGVRMAVCTLARDTITAARLDRLRGEAAEALDGHALLAQLKTAAALAIAESRLEVTDEDWQLASVISQKSAACRSEVAHTLAARVAASNQGRAEAEASRAVVVEEAVAEAAIKRVCRVIVRRLSREGGWLPHAELRRAVASRDRGSFDAAIERVIDAGQVVSEEVGRTTRYRLTEEAS